MKRIFLTLFVLALGVLACGQRVTPTPTPLASPTPPHPAQPTARPTGTATEAAAMAETPWSAVVQAAAVNIRSTPDGQVVGQLYAGQEVVILQCAGDWCEIEQGWIFKGCLTIESGLLCKAKESE